MSIDNHKDWIDILKAFLTPTIALFGIFIGFMQWWTNHKRLKIEYFNRRIAVFDAIGKYIAEILISGGIGNNAETKFRGCPYCR